MENKSLHPMTTDLENVLSEDVEKAIRREQTAFDELAGRLRESLVLFGAGSLGRMTLSGLRTVGLEPLAFADNNSLLWGRTVDGLEVLRPEEAARRFGQTAVFVVTIWGAGSSHRFDHSRHQLQDLHCSKITSFAPLFWKYHEIFLPYYAIGLPHTLHAERSEILQAADLWFDEPSRLEYLAQVKFRFTADFSVLSSPVSHSQYFPDDLYRVSADEVLIDCGAYDGDTIREFLSHCPDFVGRITALEPDSHNLKKLLAYRDILAEDLAGRFTILPYAVGAKHGNVRFKAFGSASSQIDPEGTVELESVSLDEILTGQRPTVIKMDIEGAEIDALVGARKLIAECRPILAISVYHHPNHLWNVPRLIHSYSQEYKFFLRLYNEEGWDLVCYAIPKKRLRAGIFRGES